MQSLKPKTPPKKYRTRRRAGPVTEIPETYAIITEPDYQNAIGLHQSGKAYLQSLSVVPEIKDGELRIRGFPASTAKIRDYYTEEFPKTIDLPLLRFFYSIILNSVQHDLTIGNILQKEYTLYVPELIKIAGRKATDESSHYTNNRDDAKAYIDFIMSLHSIVGYIDGNVLPILLFTGQDKEKNTISFISPYINRVIEKISKSSILTDKKGKPRTNASGKPITKATYSYLIKPTIIRERNKKAVEIVHIVITTIEQAGNNVPHLSAKTIVERNTLLKQSLNNSSTQDKNKLLKRAFSKAWELLRTQTKLLETYKDIRLPALTDVPTVSTLAGMVYEFKHSGKIKPKK